jgi:hypothetical protein
MTRHFAIRHFENSVNKKILNNRLRNVVSYTRVDLVTDSLYQHQVQESGLLGLSKSRLTEIFFKSLSPEENANSV